MSKYIKPMGWLLVVCLLVSGSYLTWGDRLPDLRTLPGISWFFSTGKPAVAVVVCESSDRIKLSPAQIAWMGSPTLRKDARAQGTQFLIVDPDVKDRGGKTPVELAPAIERAKGKLPRLVLIGPRGGLTDFVLPVDEAAARTRIGLTP